MRDAMVALLQEDAGLRDESLATWRAVRAELPRGADVRVGDRADAAIARLSRGNGSRPITTPGRSSSLSSSHG